MAEKKAGRRKRRVDVFGRGGGLAEKLRRRREAIEGGMPEEAPRAFRGKKKRQR